MPPETQEEDRTYFSRPVPVVLPGHVFKSKSLTMKTQESDSAYQKRRRRGIAIFMIIEIAIFCAVMYVTHR